MDKLESLGILFEDMYQRNAEIVHDPGALGDKMRRLRGGLPLRMVSEASDVSVKSISNVEMNGGSYYAARKMAAALGYEMAVVLVPHRVKNPKRW